MTEQELREFIRKTIKDMVNQGALGEISTTANVAGYLTPFAFRGNVSKNKKKMKDTAQKMGFTLTKKGEEDLNKKADESLQEGLTAYYQFKNDQERTAKQKIGISIREAKKALNRLDKQLYIVSKYKNEIGYSTDKYWKQTLKDMYKMEAQLIRLSRRLKEIGT